VRYSCLCGLGESINDVSKACSGRDLLKFVFQTRGFNQGIEIWRFPRGRERDKIAAIMTGDERTSKDFYAYVAGQSSTGR